MLLLSHDVDPTVLQAGDLFEYDADKVANSKVCKSLQYNYDTLRQHSRIRHEVEKPVEARQS